MKITNIRELQNAINYSSDIDFKDFMNLHKKCAINRAAAEISALSPSKIDKYEYEYLLVDHLLKTKKE